MGAISSPSLLPSSSPRLFAPSKLVFGAPKTQKKQGSFFGGEESNTSVRRNCEEVRGRRAILVLSVISSGLSVASSTSGKEKSRSPYNERRLLEQNRKIQEANHAPGDFPNFIREGFQVEVVTSDNYVKRDSGLIYWDIEVGQGDCPKDGQQVIFHYVGYNESGRRIDSTYLQGSPAKIRLGNKALVGPSTFFSAKQFEVFDVELLKVQDCQRRTIAFYSDVVCN
uniref:Rotamase n=1 Tax=Ananas comosus var. bracteatus TaxID=296719 RepID=A0A6V7QPV1_ANACO|nr:unnamed protein product [Ananas comosus var. bracteatus]